MKILKYVLLAGIIVLVVLAFVAPIGPMPGVRIGGTVKDAPMDWPDTSTTDEIKLKVAGTLPRVVILWVAEHAGELHVVGAKDSGWVKMLGQGGAVELRLADNTYPLQATLMTQGWRPVLAAYIAKYESDYPEIIAGFPPIEEAEAAIAVYRLNRT